MKKRIEAGMILIALFSCQYHNQLSSDNALTKRIETEFKTESEVIDLTQLNSFEWNELLILGPYCVIEHIEKDLDLDLDNIRGNRIEYSDDINLLIFLNNGNSVKISEISRGIGDFTDLQRIIERDRGQIRKNSTWPE
ncbi:hypothetical protein [Maribacter sp. 4G9]|uniref:hypothetical protein n=1 Tax=Maribacter sp. 4G9 TaxID=1889777 RepID=UPI000C1612C4|nr:hypothetical protein [Maribacter sp. 4G9]PIB38429.1 hypothetical protein BFP75_16110 [Maribacter sp. 4G9]